MRKQLPPQLPPRFILHALPTPPLPPPPRPSPQAENAADIPTDSKDLEAAQEAVAAAAEEFK